MPTVYITEPGVQIHKRGQRLLAVKGEDILQDIPLIKVERLILMGSGVSVTTPVLHALARNKVDVLFLTKGGGFVSRMIGREHKHSRLRHAQALSVSQEKLSFSIAKKIVEGKIHNQRVLAQRHTRKLSWAAGPLNTMSKMHSRVSGCRDLDELRGIEGTAAREYFHLLRGLIKKPRDGDSWRFLKREYYPPPDPINALLSFGYTLLLNDLIAVCQIVGLDPDLGFFHALDYGKPSMALDLEEEFRAVIVDSVVLLAVNRPIIGLNDFRAADGYRSEAGENGNTKQTQPVLLKDDARKKFITLYENRINEQVYHPASGGATTYRRVFELQAYQLASVILGKQTEYQPFLIR